MENGYYNYASSQPFNIRELHNIIDSEFHIEASMIEFGVPIFAVQPKGPSKEAFERLAQKLKPHSLLPFLRLREGKSVIQVFPKPESSPSKRRHIPLILFLATVGTIFISGYLNSEFWSKTFGENIFVHSLLFTIALLGIVGLHEMGHKTMAMKRGLKATSPYFIPGPPYPIGFGTFGAVILQKEPPVNRDQLFDMGFSGPVTGFIITLIVYTAALSAVKFVSLDLISQLATQGVEISEMPPSLSIILIDYLVNIKTAPGYLALTPPLGLAAWLGFVITFLNLLPIWQLDGGHIANAMFGEKGHKYASTAGLIIAVATGFWFFGLLILFLMGTRQGMGPLDEVSPLSTGRKMLGILSYVILALSAVILW